MNELLYKIPANTPREEVIRQLKAHPEVRFVSLVGIDMAGNDTDEKIPVRIFIEDIEKFYNGTAVQTDGSSVVLPKIATIKVAVAKTRVPRPNTRTPSSSTGSIGAASFIRSIRCSVFEGECCGWPAVMDEFYRAWSIRLA